MALAASAAASSLACGAARKLDSCGVPPRSGLTHPLVLRSRALRTPGQQSILTSRSTSAGPVLPVRAAVASSSSLTEVDIHTYDAALEAAGDRLVVLDMYTQWCGPCKLLAPKVEALAQQYQGAVFLKLDCNQENKPLAKTLGVRVVPTFKLIRRKQVVHEVAGAKYDELVAAIVKDLTEHSPLAQQPGAGSMGGAAAGAGAGAGGVVVPGRVVEVDKETFYVALQEAGERLVLLDMFTDWCGPCKILAPKLAELATQNQGVVFLKLNCNDENKPLAKALGVKSVPTVKFFKSKELKDEVRGNKFDLIVETISKLQ